MSINQFAMVEELARLVRDNIPCKHLVLAVEEALVNFLQEDFGTLKERFDIDMVGCRLDPCEDGILELEPMNPYNRLLLHRLADIFGFAHESIGEGDERHLVFQCCSETSTDILGQSHEPETIEIAHQLLRKSDSPTVLIMNVPSYQHTYKEREAAYLAARERIFADDIEEMNDSAKQRPRHIPVVARRMIAHALGKKMDPSTTIANGKTEGGAQQLDAHEAVDGFLDTDIPPEPGIRSISDKAKGKKTPFIERASPEELVQEKLASIRVSQSGRRKNGVDSENLKKENLGAAKRMFAQSLGRHQAKPGLPTNSCD